jgi:hypothetical protein
MIATIIFKEYIAMNGNVNKIDIIEVEANEVVAHKYCKLFNLQIPKDDKQNQRYEHMRINIS